MMSYEEDTEHAYQQILNHPVAPECATVVINGILFVRDPDIGFWKVKACG